MLAKASSEFPELRLCQIISNALNTNDDVFYVDDGRLAEALKKYIQWQKEQVKLMKEWEKRKTTVSPKTI